MVLKRSLNRNLLLLLLICVLGANYSLYHTAFGNQVLPAYPIMIVIASMIDLAFVAPLLLLTWKRQKLGWKNILIGIAGGLVVVRFLIPMEYLAPLEQVTWLGFAVEGGLLLLEMMILATFFIYLPRIVRSVKESQLPVIFAFSKAVNEQLKPYPIIRVICSEMLMFYYVFASWKKKPRTGEDQFTLHQKSSYMALMVMLIHATILESVGIHWLIHEKSVLLSIILLVLNMYTVLFFLGDIQAVRHNPLQVTEESLYISMGLLKRMEVKWSDIEEVIDTPEQLQKKLSKNTIQFIARDFMEVHPDVILMLKRPVPATLVMGLVKEYDQVAIRVDDPARFKVVLKGKLIEK